MVTSTFSIFITGVSGAVGGGVGSTFVGSVCSIFISFGCCSVLVTGFSGTLGTTTVWLGALDVAIGSLSICPSLVTIGLAMTGVDVAFVTMGATVVVLGTTSDSISVLAVDTFVAGVCG